MQQAQPQTATPAGKASAFFPPQGSGNFFLPAAASTIQRATQQDCLDTERGAVNTAVDAAFNNIVRALAIMDTVPVPPSVNNALFLAFRDSSDATRALVRANLVTLRNRARGATYECTRSGDVDFSGCTSPSGNARVGYASHTGSGATRQSVGNIMLCFPAFNNATPETRSGTIIHELAHYYLGLDDTGYFALGCAETGRPSTAPNAWHEDSGTAGDNPAIRLNNADSYACFVNFLAIMPAVDMEARAADYRGDNLHITARGGTYIYTETGNEQEPLFNIEGVPGLEVNRLHSSGMVFRWELEAGGVRYRVESRHTASADLFDHSNTQVYVGRNVRRLLAGASSGTVVCYTRLFDHHDGRFSPTPIVTRLPVTIRRGQDPMNMPLFP
jgi:hypothetical protein